MINGDGIRLIINFSKTYLTAGNMNKKYHLVFRVVSVFIFSPVE